MPTVAISDGVKLATYVASPKDILIHADEVNNAEVFFGFSLSDFGVAQAGNALPAQPTGNFLCMPAGGCWLLKKFTGNLFVAAEPSANGPLVYRLISPPEEAIEMGIPSFYTEQLPQGDQVGSANAINAVSFETFNKRELAVIILASGGNFGSQNMTVSVSEDNSTFTAVDSVALGVGTSAAKQYDATHLAATLAINPMNFPYVKFSVPALGAGITSEIKWGSKGGGA